MSETIPPSIVLIAVASVTGVSIAALFTAGILPALVLALVLALVAKQFGIHEAHHSMVVILAMALRLFAPPFGLCYCAACVIGQVPPEAGMRRIWIYLGWLLVGLILITFVPWISIGFL